MKVTTGLLGAVVLLGLLFLVPAARADSDTVVFTTNAGLYAPIATSPLTWTMAADQGVNQPGLPGFDPVTGGYLPEQAAINFGGGVALYGVAFFLTPGGPSELWLQFQGFAVYPTIPVPNQNPEEACGDQASWTDCMYAIYYGTGISDYPENQHPFTLSATGEELTLNPGVYSGFTISATPEPSTGLLLGVCLLCSLLIAARKAHG